MRHMYKKAQGNFGGGGWKLCIIYVAFSTMEIVLVS